MRHLWIGIGFSLSAVGGVVGGVLCPADSSLGKRIAWEGAGWVLGMVIAISLALLAGCGPHITAVTPMGIKIAGADFNPDMHIVDYAYTQVVKYTATVHGENEGKILAKAHDLTIEWKHTDEVSFNDGNGYIQVSMDFTDGSSVGLPLSYCVVAHEMTHQVASDLGVDTTNHPAPWFWTATAVQYLAQLDVHQTADFHYLVETLPATEFCYQ